MPKLLGCFSSKSKSSDDPEEDFQPNQAAIDHYRKLYDEAVKRIDQSDKDYQKIKDNLEVQRAQLEVERMKIKGMVHQLEGEKQGEKLKNIWKENERLMELIRDKDVEWDKRLDERRKEMKTAELGYYRMCEEREKKSKRKGRQVEDPDAPYLTQSIYPKLPRDLTSNPFFTGMLTVQVLDGQGLKLPREEIGKANEMYCVVEIDGIHRGYTSVADNTFRWRETFQIDVISANTIRFLINSWNPHLNHKLCHTGTMNLLERMQEIRENRVIELDLEPSGQLIVRLDFRDLNSSFQRIPSTLENRIWGAPLEELAQQEEEGKTPIVLRRLIEEVEGRGMGLEGLYTMCGAWEIKKPLRDALEIDPIHTSLSKDCIADPHVIASLIKDFLQELPEPLIPQFVHSWLLDSSITRFQSQLEPTRASVLKVLDSVPKERKTCLYLVLDHLKRIIEAGGKQERLALIFAPLIFFKFDTSNVSSGYIDVNQASETLEMILTVWPLRRRA